MRFTINVECTPDEARAFFGFPNVAPMQEALMKEMQEQMAANVRGMDPQGLLQMWLPASMQAFEKFQKAFWSQMEKSEK